MKNKPKDPILRQLSDEYASLDSKIKDLRKEADNLSSKIKIAQREQDEIRTELGFARDAMNSEFKKMQINQQENQKDWDTYRRILDRNNPEIDRLKSQADNKASTMKDCFAKSQSCWQSGDKSSAKYYSDEGKKLKSEVEDLNSRISDLCAENKRAKPVNSGSLNYAFNNAKSIFDRVKQDFDRKKEITRELIAKHQSVISKIKDIQSEKDRIKDKQQVRVVQLKQDFTKKVNIDKSSIERILINFLLHKAIHTTTKREYQLHENGVSIKVLAGWSKNYKKPTTDIIIADANISRGHHLHLVITEDGEIIHNKWTKNH